MESILNTALFIALALYLVMITIAVRDGEPGDIERWRQRFRSRLG